MLTVAYVDGYARQGLSATCFRERTNGKLSSVTSLVDSPMALQNMTCRYYLNGEAEERGVEDVPVVDDVGVAVGADEASDGGVVAHGAASVQGEADTDPLVLDAGVFLAREVGLGLELKLVSGLGPVNHHGAVLSKRGNIFYLMNQKLLVHLCYKTRIK